LAPPQEKPEKSGRRNKRDGAGRNCGRGKGVATLVRKLRISCLGRFCWGLRRRRQLPEEGQGGALPSGGNHEPSLAFKGKKEGAQRKIAKTGRAVERAAGEKETLLFDEVGGASPWFREKGNIIPF